MTAVGTIEDLHIFCLLKADEKGHTEMDVHHAGNFLLVQQLHESNNFLQKTYHWLAPSQPHKNLGNNRRDLILLTWIKL